MWLMQVLGQHIAELHIGNLSENGQPLGKRNKLGGLPGMVAKLSSSPSRRGTAANKPSEYG